MLTSANVFRKGKRWVISFLFLFCFFPEGMADSSAEEGLEAATIDSPAAEVTQGVEALQPDPKLSKIGQIVVIFLENRSFNHLFGNYPGVNGISTAKSQDKILQIGPDGEPYSRLPPVLQGIYPTKKTEPDPSFPEDLPNEPLPLNRYISLSKRISSPIHLFYTNQRQINGGKNDRFVVEGERGALPMGYWEKGTKGLWLLAKQFTLADNFFQSAYGGSFLNHQWLVCACTPPFPNAPAKIVALNEEEGKTASGEEAIVTSDGYAVNTIQGSGLRNPKKRVFLPPLTAPTIGDRLSEKGIPWVYYAEGYTDAMRAFKNGKGKEMFAYHHQPFTYYKRFIDSETERREHLQDLPEFEKAIQKGELPPVSFFKPILTKSMHPGLSSLMTGDAYATKLVRMIMKGKQWHNTVIILAMDENGGFWDHAYMPPKDRWGPGSRVPALIISPFSKGGKIDSTPYETLSILKLIEERFGLQPLGERDAQANSLANALDLESDSP